MKERYNGGRKENESRERRTCKRGRERTIEGEREMERERG